MNRPAVVLFALIGVAGCTEHETNQLTAVGRDSPPRIILQGPDFGASGVETQFQGPELFVLVADSNGLDDISAVLFNVDSVRLNATIVRRDTSTTTCAAPGYIPSDTIDIRSLLPTRFPGLRNALMEHVQGGLWASPPLVLPDIVAASTALGTSPKGCAFGGNWLTFFGIFPPAVPTPRTAFLTYADAQYFGMTATVYDAAGASATATFPTLRVVFTTPEEKATAP